MTLDELLPSTEEEEKTGPVSHWRVRWVTRTPAYLTHYMRRVEAGEEFLGTTHFASEHDAIEAALLTLYRNPHRACLGASEFLGP